MLVLATLRDHHERLDGGGYPAGRKADAIHEFARICAIADVFDAVSSERPYKHAAPSYVVVNVIGKEVAAGGLDPAIAAAFQRVCMPFPLGADVVEEGECLGVVSAIDADDPWLPTVRRMEGATIVEVTTDMRHLDTSRQMSSDAILASAAGRAIPG